MGRQMAGPATSTSRWVRAGFAARLIMGKTEPRRGRPSVWRADEDPAAWWCATELIFNISKGIKDEEARHSLRD